MCLTLIISVSINWTTSESNWIHWSNLYDLPLARIFKMSRTNKKVIDNWEISYWNSEISLTDHVNKCILICYQCLSVSDLLFPYNPAANNVPSLKMRKQKWLSNQLEAMTYHGCHHHQEIRHHATCWYQKSLYQPVEGKWKLNTELIQSRGRFFKSFRKLSPRRNGGHSNSSHYRFSVAKCKKEHQ